MRKNDNIIMRAVLLIAAIALAAGCMMEKHGIHDGMKNVLIQVNVSTGVEQTRATEAPTFDESVINSVRIYAFYGSKPCGYYYSANLGEPIIMDMHLPETGRHSVDFYVVANEAAMNMTDGMTLSESTTAARLMDIKFNSMNDLAANGIPMYWQGAVEIDVDAVRDVANTEAGHEGHVYLAQRLDIDLNRSFAKISVMAARTDEGSITIKEVKMLAKGTRQYNYLFEGADLTSVPVLPDDRILLADDMVIEARVTDATKTDPAYYDNLTPNGEYVFEVPYGSVSWNAENLDNSVVLQVIYSTGAGQVEKTGTIYMPAIERNTHYKVLCSIAAEGVLTVTYIVEDWEDAVMWENGLVFEYPNHSDLMPSAETSDLPESPAVMSAAEPFKGYFRLTSPEHQTWNPTLLDGSAVDYTVEVYLDGVLVDNPENYVASEKWYMIKVIPNNPDNFGKDVRLAVTYKPMLSEQAEFLMINSGHIWPLFDDASYESSTDYVIITQK